MKKQTSVSKKDFYSFYSTDGDPAHPRVSFKKAKKMSLAVRVALVLFLGLLASSAWFGYLYFSDKLTGSKDLVALEVRGPQNAENGSSVEYEVSYRNTSQVPIPDAALFVEFPIGFTVLQTDPQAENTKNNFWNLGTLAKGQQATVRIRGTLSGFTDEEKVLLISLQYTHPAYRSAFIIKKEFRTTLGAASAESLSFQGPKTINAGDEASITIRYQDVSKLGNPEKVILALTLPNEVTISKSSPDISNADAHEWNGFALSKSIRPDVRGGVLAITIAVAQTLQGPQTIKARLFLRNDDASESPLLSVEYPFDVIREDLALSLVASDGTSSALAHGDSPTVVGLLVENKGTVVFHNITVRLIDRDDVIDYDTSSFENADRSEKTVTWSYEKNAALKEIKSGGRVVLPFSLSLRPTTQEVGLALNATIGQREENPGSLITTQKDIEGSLVSVPIISDIKLRAFARDMGVAEGKKIVRVYYGITHSIHDSIELEVRGILGKNVTWSTVNSRTAGDISYNGEKREALWTLNALPETVKRIDGSFDVTVPTSFPTSEPVMEKIVFSAKDRVLNAPVSQKIDTLTITETGDGL